MKFLRWSIVILIIIVLAVIILVGFSLDTSKPFCRQALIWQDYQGVALMNCNNAAVVDYQLFTKNGQQITSPSFCISDSTMIYWSKDDRSICVVNEGGKSKWIKLSDESLHTIQKINNLANITDIDASEIFLIGTNVFINMDNIDGHSIGTIELNIDSQKDKVLNDTIWISADSSDSTSYIAINNKYDIKLHKSDNTVTLLKIGNNSRDIRFDSSADIITCRDGNEIIARKLSTSDIIWKIHTKNTVTSYDLNSREKNVLIGLYYTKAISIGVGSILEYTYDGQTKGIIAKTGSTDPIIEPILFVNNRKLKLLNNYKKITLKKHKIYI